MRVSGIWRTGVIVLAVFSVAWACAIVWWRVGNVTPGGAGMLAWLVVMPVGILSLLWMGARLRRRAASAAQTTALDGEAAAADDGVRPQCPPDILAAAINLGCGQDARALAGRLPELPRPGLHPTLRDRDGLPVLAAFSAELETASLADRLPAVPGQRLADEHLRALALLEPVALELFDSAARLLPPLPEARERVVAGLRRTVAASPGSPGGVDVVLLLAQDAPPTLRSACGGWLHELSTEAGLDPRRISVEVVCVTDADSAWQRIQHVMLAEPAEGADWRLLLATDSSIGERGLHALLPGGRLATAHNAEGLVPGEGAAGLLLRPAGAIRPLAEQPAPVLAAVRTVSGGDTRPHRAGRATGDLLEQLMDTAGVARDDVAVVISDADQRPSRAVEAAVAASTACPELDPSADCLALGSASGHLGHVAPLALLALASARVREAHAPALALSVASAHARTAALLRTAVANDIPRTPASETGGPPDLAA